MIKEEKRVTNDAGTDAHGDPEVARLSLGDFAGDLTIEPLDEGDRVAWAFVLMKTEAADGNVSWSFRTTAPPNLEELLGALQVQVDLLRRRLLEEWT